MVEDRTSRMNHTSNEAQIEKIIKMKSINSAVIFSVDRFTYEITKVTPCNSDIVIDTSMESLKEERLKVFIIVKDYTKKELKNLIQKYM